MSNKLKIAKQFAREKLRERIELGKKMNSAVKGPGNFHANFENFEKDLKKWSAFNRRLLSQIFDDQAVLDGYLEAIQSAGAIVTSTETEVYRNLEADLLEEISYLESCIEQLELFESPSNTGSVISEGDAYDGFKIITKIFQDANQSLLLADNWVDNNTLDLLAYKQRPVKVNLLTAPKCLDAAMKTAARHFDKQHGPLEIGATNDIHDRFLIVDDRNVYILGGSIKDIGKKMTMIMPISDPSLLLETKTRLQKIWNGSIREKL